MPGSSMAPQQQPPNTTRGPQQAPTTAQPPTHTGKLQQQKKHKRQKASGSTASSTCNLDRPNHQGEVVLAAGQVHAATTPSLAAELAPSLAGPSALTASDPPSRADGRAAPIYLTLPTSTSSMSASIDMRSVSPTFDHHQHSTAVAGALSALCSTPAAPHLAEVTLSLRPDTLCDDVSLAAAATNKTDACFTGHTVWGPYQSSISAPSQSLESTLPLATSTSHIGVDSLRPSLQQTPSIFQPSGAVTPTASVPNWAAEGPQPGSPRPALRPSLPLPIPDCPEGATASAVDVPSLAAGGPQPDLPRPPSTASLPLPPSLQSASALPDLPNLNLPKALLAIFASSASPGKRTASGLDWQEEQQPLPHSREAPITPHLPAVHSLPVSQNEISAASTAATARESGKPALTQTELNLELSQDTRFPNCLKPNSVRLSRPIASFNDSMPPGYGETCSTANTKAGLSELVDVGRQMVDMGEQILHAGSSTSNAPPAVSTVGSRQVRSGMINLTGDGTDPRSCNRSRSK